MNTIRVTASKQYEVRIARGLLAEAGRMIKEIAAPCKVCIVTDDNVERQYADRVQTSLAAQGFDTHRFSFPHGEMNKTLERRCGSDRAAAGSGARTAARSARTRACGPRLIRPLARGRISVRAFAARPVMLRPCPRGAKIFSHPLYFRTFMCYHKPQFQFTGEPKP